MYGKDQQIKGAPRLPVHTVRERYWQLKHVGRDVWLQSGILVLAPPKPGYVLIAWGKGGKGGDRYGLYLYQREG